MKNFHGVIIPRCSGGEKSLGEISEDVFGTFFKPIILGKIIFCDNFEEIPGSNCDWISRQISEIIPGEIPYEFLK